MTFSPLCPAIDLPEAGFGKNAGGPARPERPATRLEDEIVVHVETDSRAPDLAVRVDDAGSDMVCLPAGVWHDMEAQPQAGFREGRGQFVERGGQTGDGAGVARG